MLGLPLVDGAVEHPGRDLRQRQMPQRGEHAEAETELVTVDGGGRVKAPLPPVADYLDVVGEQDAFVDLELGGALQVLEELVRCFLVGDDKCAGDALAGVRVDPAGTSTDPGGGACCTNR